MESTKLKEPESQPQPHLMVPGGMAFDDDAVVVDASTRNANGQVGTRRRRKRVALVGFASSSRTAAPFNDDSWEIWGLNQLNRYIPRATRWFEVHNRPAMEADIVRDTDYVGWLRQCPIPVYVDPVGFDAGAWKDIPNAVRLPIEQMTDTFGQQYLGDPGPRPYFTATPPYMIALALLLGYEEIGIWGIDLIVGREYDFEKACTEYFLGIVRGRGVTLTLPATTALLKASYRYGIDREPDPGPFAAEGFASRRHQLAERQRQLEEQQRVTQKEIDAIAGAFQENAFWDEVRDRHAKGGTILLSTAPA